MARVWSGAPDKYECAVCHRICIATKDGFLPRHRPPGKRILCDGTGASVKFHKKVGS